MSHHISVSSIQMWGGTPVVLSGEKKKKLQILNSFDPTEANRTNSLDSQR